MTAYTAPLEDIRFLIHDLIDLGSIGQLPGYEEATPDLVDAILEEAGRFGQEVLAPLNRAGDRGCTFENGIVRTVDGFASAYRQFVDGGWNTLQFSPEHGGQGMPWLISTAVSEIWHAANMAFGLCPMLTQAAAEVVEKFGSDELKTVYLEKLISGEWCGTMNLTEPQAGSDLSRVRTRAEPEGEHYRITGQKIYITYGEHDMADNIVHLVLARLPGAPEGVKGISLFVVPKFVPDDEGQPGTRNDIRCVSIEHKLGINGSPTAVLSFGDDGGAIGWMLGEANRGLEHMFLMMNNARLAVGLEGVGIAERAYQAARAYAAVRVQGRNPIEPKSDGVTIDHHPDVQRMLFSMKSQTEAARALAYFTAANLDKALRHPDQAVRERYYAMVALMTPVVKAWSTDIGIYVADTGVQVHGGMGYIEESGAPQHLRDARIAAIYEGTNGIQALDLVGRKIVREQGATVSGLIATMRADLDNGLNPGDEDAAVIQASLAAGVDALASATDWLLRENPTNVRAVGAAAYPYLQLLGTVAGGWLLAKGAVIAAERLEAGTGNAAFLESKRLTARYYADTMLSRAEALGTAVVRGGAAISRIDPSRHL